MSETSPSLVDCDYGRSVRVRKAVDLLEEQLTAAERELDAVGAEQRKLAVQQESLDRRLSCLHQTKKNIIDAIVKLRNG